jgi:hypothetical protein
VGNPVMDGIDTAPDVHDEGENNGEKHGLTPSKTCFSGLSVDFDCKITIDTVRLTINSLIGFFYLSINEMRRR